MSLLVVGTVAFDAIETPFGKTDRIVGGAATYISLAASFFYKPVNLVSVVGDDFPAEMLADLAKRGVNQDGLQIRKGEKSFFWSGKYGTDLNSRTTLDTQLNVVADFDPILPESYRKPEYLMLGNLVPDLQFKVIEQLKHKPRLIVMDTMNLWLDIAREAVLHNLRHVDLLMVNDEEARQLSGEYSLVKAAKVIMAMGPDFLIIKKGEHGALLFHGQEVFFAPALPLEEVFDPTGAGDTFAGGFLGYLAGTRDVTYENMKSAVIYGSAMASFVVEKFGPERLLAVKKEEIRNRCRSFLELVQVDINLG
jgi:sugar/nucleoside kinase (ribokinase family)